MTMKCPASSFEDLSIPEPDIYLGVGSGSHAAQTAKILIAFEQVVLKPRPDLVLVVGNVNSTLAYFQHHNISNFRQSPVDNFSMWEIDK